jgi:hypothetical protein
VRDCDFWNHQAVLGNGWLGLPNHQSVGVESKQATGAGVIKTVVRTPVTRARKRNPASTNHA